MDKSQTNAVITIDLESLPETDTFNYAEPTIDDVGENGTLKDPIKIAEWKEKKLAELKEKTRKDAEEKHHDTGLVSYKGRIFCICYAINDEEPKVIDFLNGEKEMLVAFNNDIKQYRTVNFVGVNLAFDLSFILHRAFHYRLFDLANIIRLDRGYTKGRDFDLMDLFFGAIVWKPKVSLDNMCKLMGVPTSKDKMEGSEVFKYYLEGRYNEIREYCKKDVIATRQLFKLLK